MTMNPVMHLTDTVSVMGQVLPEEIAPQGRRVYDRDV